MQINSEDLKDIGGDFQWLLVRTGVSFFLFVGSLGAILALSLPIMYLLPVFAIGVFLRFYSVSRVRANSCGVVFQRWFRERHIRWSEIDSMRYKPFRFPEVTLLMKRPVAGSRRIEISKVTTSNLKVSEAKDMLLGRTEPDIIKWIRDQIPPKRLQ